MHWIAILAIKIEKGHYFDTGKEEGTSGTLAVFHHLFPYYIVFSKTSTDAGGKYTRYMLNWKFKFKKCN